MAESGVVIHDGVEWALEQDRFAGSAESLSIILIHGAIANLRAWDRTREELANHPSSPRIGRVISIDLPCHGVTIGGDLDYETCARGLAAVADELELERPILVGHSFGGLVATTAAARRPDRFGGAMAVDPYLSDEDSRSGQPTLHALQDHAAAAGWPFPDAGTVDEAIVAFFRATGIGGKRVEAWERILRRGYQSMGEPSRGVTYRPQLADNLRSIEMTWAFPIDDTYDEVAPPLAIVLAVGNDSMAYDERTARERWDCARALQARRAALGRATTLLEVVAPHDVPGTAPRELADIVASWVSVV